MAYGKYSGPDKADNNKFFMVMGCLNAALGAFGMFVIGAQVFPIIQFVIALLSLSRVKKE